jgi:hypothetical protein
MQQAKMQSAARFFRAFTDHPATVGENYLQHLCFAMRFSIRLFAAAGAAMIHAIVPAWFETTASDLIKRMYEDLNRRH